MGPWVSPRKKTDKHRQGKGDRAAPAEMVGVRSGLEERKWRAGGRWRLGKRREGIPAREHSIGKAREWGEGSGTCGLQ